MTRRSLRLFLCGLIILALIIAFFKLAFTDWYLFTLTLCSCAGILLQWAITSDDRPSIKKGDD